MLTFFRFTGKRLTPPGGWLSYRLSTLPKFFTILNSVKVSKKVAQFADKFIGKIEFIGMIIGREIALSAKMGYDA